METCCAAAVTLRASMTATTNERTIAASAENRPEGLYYLRGYGRAMVWRLNGPVAGPKPPPPADVSTTARVASNWVRWRTFVTAVILSYGAPATSTTVGESIGLY